MITARIEDSKIGTINNDQDGVYTCRVCVYEAAEDGTETKLGQATYRHALDNAPVAQEVIQAGVNRLAKKLLARYRSRVQIDCSAITLDPTL